MKDAERQKNNQHNWYLRNRERILLSKKGYYKILRAKAYEKLGGKCIYCGCDIQEALEINHINGGGHQEKKYIESGPKSIYYDIIGDKRNDLEIACRVCNSVHYLEIVKGLGKHWKVTFIP
jgi:5-methylcytosine-specific restriction endonuclease McrA